MVRLLDFKGKLRSEFDPTMLQAQGLVVYIQPQVNTNWAVDKVIAQSPDVPATGTVDVPEDTVLYLTMSGSAQGVVVNSQPAPAPEVYLPHGEPVRATLMLRSKVPVQLELVVTPNVSLTVSTTKEQKIAASGTPDQALKLKQGKVADGRTVPA